MKSHEMTVEVKGTNAIKMWKSFCGKQAERGAINKISKNGGGGTLDGIPPHRFESHNLTRNTKQVRQSPDL